MSVWKHNLVVWVPLINTKDQQLHSFVVKLCNLSLLSGIHILEVMTAKHCLLNSTYALTEILKIWDNILGKGIWGGVTINKTTLKSHMESYYCRSFIKCMVYACV